MGQILRQENIPPIVRASATLVTLAATNGGAATAITLGGQQYLLSFSLNMFSSNIGAGGLDVGTLGASQIWYTYVIVHATTGAPALIASLALPSVGPTIPSGYSAVWKLVGKFATNLSSQISTIVDLYQPQYLCSIYRGGANVTGLGNGNHVALLDTALHDPFGWFVSGSNSIQPKVAGRYLATWTVKHAPGSANGLANTTATLEKNGSVYAFQYGFLANSAAGFNGHNDGSSVIVDMNGTSDTVRVTINVDRFVGTHGYTGGGNFTRLELIYLGPLT